MLRWLSSFTIGGVDFDTKLVILIVLTTTLSMLDYYGHSPTRWMFETLQLELNLPRIEVKAYDRIVFYLLIPLALILAIFWENPAEYGFQLGNWREGMLWTIGSIIGMGIILWFVARNPSMQGYYDSRAPEGLWRIVYVTGVDLLGWEFIWRGLLLFGLAPIIGVGPAIWVQAIPFAFMHLGKPEVETLTTIVGGAAFGFVAWRTDSFVYPFLIHCLSLHSLNLSPEGFFNRLNYVDD